MRRGQARRGLAEAYAYCEAAARSHYENFPVGSILAPSRLRPHVHAVYAYARAADDFADEPEHTGRRLEQIDRWEARLDRCLRGSADHPVFVALGDTIRRFELPEAPLRDLLDAFRQDCRVGRYERWEELLDYCRRSANPIGRMVLHVFGYRDEERCRRSDAICTGLQLANFWQDVAVDLAKDRIYLPREDRIRHGVTERDLAAGASHAGCQALVTEVAARTRGLFEEGRPLLRAVRLRLGAELRFVWLGGTTILDKVEAYGARVFRERPVLSGRERIRLLARALAGAGVGR